MGRKMGRRNFYDVFHGYGRVVRQRDELLAALEDVIGQIYAEGFQISKGEYAIVSLGPIDLRKAETAILNAKK